MGHAPGFKEADTILIWATWIFARQWNASKGEPCLIESLQLRSTKWPPRFDLLAVSARSKSQVPDVLTVVVLAQVYLRIGEVPPGCNRKMGECGLAILSAVDQTVAPHDAKTIMTFLVAISNPAFKPHLCQL